MKNVSAYRIIGSFLLGSAVLIILSFIQKLIAGFNPYILKAYLIPFLFGGITGTLIGLYIAKINELNQKLLQRVDSLEHLLPICSYCKKIRKADSDPADIDSWDSVESYISENMSSTLTHGVCPECTKRVLAEIDDIKSRTDHN